MNWSIERKLPLLVVTLLLAVALLQLTVGYIEVRQASRRLADQRLPLATKVLADLFQIPQGRARITALAKDPAIVAFLRSGGRRGREQALAALHRITNDTASNAALELRDLSGKLLLRSGRFAIADSVLVSPGTDSARYGPFLRRDSTLFLAAAFALREGDDERAGGIVQQVRRVVFDTALRKNLTGLAGGDIALSVGNATGDPWTDFGAIIPAPPRQVLASPIPIRYERDGKMRRASAASVPGTPWMVVAELPSSVVAAPARAYLVNMVPTAALIVLLGALIAWWGSQRITRPLQEVSTAAEAIAAGDLTRRASVAVSRSDELGRLAASFNIMAEQVARSLQHSEAMLHGVTETAHDAIIAADAEGTIRFWNPGAGRTFGYRTDEVLGQPLTILMPERFQDAHRAGMRRFLETGERRVVGTAVELVGRRKDGSEFPIEVSLGAARVGAGVSFTGVIRDITARKQIEHSLKATNAELESFSYSVSHDLRQPLRAIHGFARILLEDHHAELDPEAQRLLGVIDQNTLRMGQLIDDLLAFSRLGRKELETRRVDMAEVADGVAAEVRRADADRPLEIKIFPLPPARGDCALLRQVLSNLVHNAVKFTRGRNPARVEIGVRPPAPPDGPQTVYYVRDNGAGFDPRYADKLFGVFQRLHRAEEFEGTGVGLAIVKRIVERHGGRVWAEAQVNEGATFYFTLPTAEG